MLVKFYNMDFIGFMTRKGYSVGKLAEMLGVSKDSVYAYRNGRCKPSYEVLEKLFVDGATIAEMFSEEIEAKIVSQLQVSQQEPINEAEIVRKGLLELAKHLQG